MILRLPKPPEVNDANLINFFGNASNCQDYRRATATPGVWPGVAVNTMYKKAPVEISSAVIRDYNPGLRFLSL